MHKPDLQPLHLWLQNTEPCVRWEELRDLNCSTPELVQTIRERITQSTAALDVFGNTIDFHEEEATYLTNAVGQRLDLFSNMASAPKCSKLQRQHCLPPILQEGYARVYEAGRYLGWYQQHSEECDEDALDGVYETIVLFHEVIHRYLRAPTKE